MTEILGDPGSEREPDDAPYPARYGTPAASATDLDAPAPATRHPGHARSLIKAVAEPATLSVLAALSVGIAALQSPLYRFDGYPFNQGVESVSSVFTNGTLTQARPLHTYLVNAGPAVVLAGLALLTGGWAVLRGRPGDAGWVRPLAAGSMLAGLVLLVVFGVGAYRTSSLDLAPADLGTSTP